MRTRTILLALLGLLLTLPAAAETTPAADPATRELVVATKQAPPFAMKGSDGAWQGISIELWRRIADQLHLRYRLMETDSVEALLDATAQGKADVGIAAITVTADRAQHNDFSQPYYHTGLGVAVQGGVGTWLPLMRAFWSLRFVQAVAVLLTIALVVGVLIWLFERRGNDHFAGPPAKGLTSGVWWSAVAMTQAGAAQNGPASLPGRLVAVVWMIASIIALAVFTAGITSAITTHQLQGLVRNLDDLRSLRVGVVNGSSSEDFLQAQRIPYRGFADPGVGLKAVQAQRIDAFVYDRPLLTWAVRQDFSGLQVLNVTFDHQSYAIALPPDSKLRAQIDVALLQAVESDWWRQVLYRYLGVAGTPFTE